jgi:hypothetical protein
MEYYSIPEATICTPRRVTALLPLPRVRFFSDARPSPAFAGPSSGPLDRGRRKKAEYDSSIDTVWQRPCSLFVWLVADGWFVVREKYCWLVAGGWFVLREKYCWLVADKPNEHAFLASGGDTCPRSRVVVPTRQSPITFNIYIRVHHICLNILAPREYHLFIILHSYYLTEVYWVNKLLKSWAIFERLHTIKNENNSLKWEKRFEFLKIIRFLKIKPTKSISNSLSNQIVIPGFLQVLKILL